MDPLEKILATYGTDINEASNTYGIAPELLASLIYQESRGNPQAVSPVGAMGLTQIMPDTAKYLGVKDPFNPKEAIHGGAKYLREQYDKFGNVESALAAYNAGPGNVEKYGGIPPFKETQKYVPSILGRVQNRSIGTNTNPKAFSSYDDASNALDQILGGNTQEAQGQPPQQTPSYKTTFNNYDEASNALDQILGPLDTTQTPQQVPAEAGKMAASGDTGPYNGNLNKVLSFAEGAYRGTGGAVRDKLLGALGLQNPEDYAAAAIGGTTPKTAANVRKTLSKYAAMQEPGANIAGELAPLLVGGGVSGAVGKGVGAAVKAPRIVKTAADLGAQALTNSYLLDPNKDVKSLAEETAVGLLGGAALSGGTRIVGKLAKTVGRELLGFQNNLSSDTADYAINKLTTSFTKQGLLKKAEAEFVKDQTRLKQFLNEDHSLIKVDDIINPKYMEKLAKAYKAADHPDAKFLQDIVDSYTQPSILKGQIPIQDAAYLKHILWVESKFKVSGEPSIARSAQSAFDKSHKLRSRLLKTIKDTRGEADAKYFEKISADYGATKDAISDLSKRETRDRLGKLIQFLSLPQKALSTEVAPTMALGKIGNTLQNSADSAILQALGIKTGQGVFNAANK